MSGEVILSYIQLFFYSAYDLLKTPLFTWGNYEIDFIDCLTCFLAMSIVMDLYTIVAGGGAGD